VLLQGSILKNKVIVVQLVLAFLVWLFYNIKNPDIIVGFSATIGSGIALINTIVFLLSVKIAQNAKQAKEGIVIAYLFAGVRFVLVGILLVVGIMSGLTVLPMIVGFVIVQLGQFINLFKFK
jgi:F0F1-type ATP synthase assembly protein I